MPAQNRSKKQSPPPARRTRGAAKAPQSSDEFETASDGEGHGDVFSAEEAEAVVGEIEESIEILEDNQEMSEGSESDSDDAPEEESMNSGRNKTKQLEIQKQQMQAEAKKADREKRREQNVKFTQQQEEKKTRLAEKKKDSDVPDLLPEDFLESLQNGGDESDNKDDAPASKHMKMEDFEEMERDEIRKQIKQQQAKALREAKKATIKKGPVRVTALSAKKIGLVPVSENRVTNARNKWMKRKSLGKR